MSTLTSKLESLLNRGKGTEQRLARFLLDSRDNFVAMNVAELAQAAGVSSASVIRFTRQMGYHGYSDFKVDYLSDEKQYKAESLSGSLNPYDDTEQIIAKSGQCLLQPLKNRWNYLIPTPWMRLRKK